MLTKPFVASLPRPAHVSHRGGAALAPENTMAAFLQACDRWHTDQLELDVRMTRDGIPVVFHDETVERTTDGEGRVRDLSLDEIQRLDAGFRFSPDGGRTFPFRDAGVYVPTLDEVLHELRVWVMCEIKDGDADARQAVLDVVDRRGALDRICLGCEEDGQALELARTRPDAALFFPAGAAGAFVHAVFGGRPVPELPFDVLALPAEAEGLDVVSAPLLQAAHERGIQVQVWTVNQESEMIRYLTRGVDAVQTDRPDLLRRALDSAGTTWAPSMSR